MPELLENSTDNVWSFDAESLTPGSLRYDMLMALPAFHRLLNTCIGRYLTDPDDFEAELIAVRAARQTPPPSAPDSDDDRHLNEYTAIQPSEGPLIGKLSGWGILAADIGVAIEPQADQIDQRWLQAAMRRPELFAQPANPWVADRISAFGQAYMRDMYATTGLTAPEPDANLSIEEQVEVLGELFSAVQQLGQTETDATIPFSADEIDTMLATEDESGQPYYDPLLLSPQAFPNKLGLEPTCAAQMAIFAGFCEAAGWPHMTANTLTLGETYSKSCLGRVTSETRQLLLQVGLHASDQEVLQQTLTSVDNTINRDLGFHGCNLVRLADGHWWQWDLTRGIGFQYSPEHSARLDIVYDSLQVARQENAPMMRPFNEIDFLMKLDNISDAAIDTASRLLDVTHIKQQLNSLGKRATLDDIVDRLILPVLLPELPQGHAFLGGGGSPHRRLIVRDIPHWLRSTHRGKEFVRQAARELLTKQGFVNFTSPSEVVPHKASHGNQPCRDGCLQEALANPQKYTSLVHWVRTAPIMFYQKLANDLCKQSLKPEHRLPHPSLELANSAMHLGATVLSAYADIYAQPDEELPAAWWPTYEPTHSGSLTHMHDALGTSSLSQAVNTINLFKRLPGFSLLDTSKRSRIEEFLKSVNTDATSAKREV